MPLLRAVEVFNDGSQPLTDVELSLHAEPAVLRPRTWRIDRVAAGGSVSLKDLAVSMSEGYLAGLDESERGTLVFRFRNGSRTVCETTSPVRVLSRHEWGGSAGVPLLPAFVMPNDPAVARLLKEAASALERGGHRATLEGYQSGDTGRVFMLGAAVWSAAAGWGLTYANPPASFEHNGQKVRPPSQIAEQQLATCLDTSLLLAAAWEAVGLNPVVVLTHEHAVAGFWLTQRTLASAVVEDPVEIRKAVNDRELVLVETTQLASRPPGTFEAAREEARSLVANVSDGEDLWAVDVRRSRMNQITPLSSGRPAEDDCEPSKDAAPLPLPAPPSAGVLPAEMTEELPTSREGRLDRWQRRLLDLSLRNSLLNFKDTQKTIPLVCGDVAALEDRIAEGKPLTLVPLPEAGGGIGRGGATLRSRAVDGEESRFAVEAFQRHELVASLTEATLQRRLTGLYRAAKNDLSEGGTNTLFLAVGMLSWRRDGKGPAYRAPILLIPAKLLRKSVQSPYRVEGLGEDTQFNATLSQMLKKDFDLDLSPLEAALPQDDRGVDVPGVLDRVRAAVRDVAGFEVLEEAAVSTFSFAKYLMWKDLADRTQLLEQNRLVRHLLRDPDKVYPQTGQGDVPQAEEMDRRYRPCEVVHPLPADSSQLAAVMAAAEGHDFVLEGPPGTGKSQTITNIIAQCLATGKTVLFAAEKTAALDVVHRRLKEHGLGELCVELHSRNAERRRFLQQLGDAWDAARGGQSRWGGVTGDLEVRRDELNAYAEALHKTDSSGWSPFRAIAATSRGEAVFDLDWNAGRSIDADRYNEIQSLMAELETAHRGIADCHGLETVCQS